MKKEILKILLLWIIIMIFAGTLGLLFAKTEGSEYGLPILIFGIIGLWLGISILYRFAQRQYPGKGLSLFYLEFKPNVIYKTLISIPFEGHYLVIIQEQNGPKKPFMLNEKPPKWFKYTGDPNNPYEILLPQ